MMCLSIMVYKKELELFDSYCYLSEPSEYCTLKVSGCSSANATR